MAQNTPSRTGGTGADQPSGASDGGESLEELAARERVLAERLSQVREQRVQAQRQVARTPLLRAALERVSRDRSTRTTASIEEMREVSQRRADEIAEHTDAVNDIRQKVRLAHLAYPDVAVPQRLSAALAEEADWREHLSQDSRATTYRLQVPAVIGEPFSAEVGAGEGRDAP